MREYDVRLISDRRKPPKNEYLEDLPRCKNCGEAFEEHEAESDPPYLCPYEHQPDSHYARPVPVGEFHPDPEMCTPEEIEKNIGIGVTVFPNIYYEQ